MGAVLLDTEESPFILVNGSGQSPYVLVCEHASNLLPDRLGTLGLEDAELLSHIAWDIGAEKVARRLSQLIDAPLVLQRYSRLAYDCNRPPDIAERHAGDQRSHADPRQPQPDAGPAPCPHARDLPAVSRRRLPICWIAAQRRR